MMKFLGFVILLIASSYAASLSEQKRNLLDELESLLEDTKSELSARRDSSSQENDHESKKDQGDHGLTRDSKKDAGTPGFTWNSKSKKDAGTPGFTWNSKSKKDAGTSGFTWKRESMYESLKNQIADIAGERQHDIHDSKNEKEAWKRVVNSVENYINVVKKTVHNRESSTKKEVLTDIKNLLEKALGNDVSEKKKKTISKDEQKKAIPSVYRNGLITHRGGDAQYGQGSQHDSRKRELLKEIKDLVSNRVNSNIKDAQPPSPNGLVWKDNKGKTNKLYKRLLDDLNSLFAGRSKKENKLTTFHDSTAKKDSKLNELNDDLAELVQSTS